MAEIEDESSQANGLRIHIELQRGADPDTVLNGLYEHTQLQTTFELQLTATVDARACTLSLGEAIGHYVEHRRDVVARRTGLRSEVAVLDIVRRDLLDVATTHGDERRSEIA